LNEDDLKSKLTRAIQQLDEAPKEKQREIFTDLLQFIEIHATKIKLGVYSASSQSKPVGGSAAASGSNVISILDGVRSQGTVGSRTFKVGGGCEIRTRVTF